MRLLSGLSIGGYGMLATDDINFLDRNVYLLANSERDENDERNIFDFCPKTCGVFSQMQIRPYAFETCNNQIVKPITLAELNYWNSRCIGKRVSLVVSNSCNKTFRVPIENLNQAEMPILRVKQYNDDELLQILDKTFKRGLELKESLNR